MPAPKSNHAGVAEQRAAVPIGPRVEAVLAVAYAARRPLMLEGATGIGNSELVEGYAARNGLGCIALDLSLMEPPDLLGLPSPADGFTRYAPPAILPRSGAGLPMIEDVRARGT
jgi:MoxR-like ATPase